MSCEDIFCLGDRVISAERMDEEGRLTFATGILLQSLWIWFTSWRSRCRSGELGEDMVTILRRCTRGGQMWLVGRYMCQKPHPTHEANASLGSSRSMGMTQAKSTLVDRCQ